MTEYAFEGARRSSATISWSFEILATRPDLRDEGIAFYAPTA